MQSSCRRTILGCYVGYIVQAIVNNFVPLLFVMFERTYQIPLSKITLLITLNFCIQLGIDLLSAWFLDRIGYRGYFAVAYCLSCRTCPADHSSGYAAGCVYGASDRRRDLRRRRRAA